MNNKSVILCAGIENMIIYPRIGAPLGFEQWGNAFAYQYNNVVQVSLDYLKNNVDKDFEILFIEVSLWKRAQFVYSYKYHLEDKLIIGLDHAPPNTIEVFAPDERECIINAWDSCDMLFTVTEKSKLYMQKFTDTEVHDEIMFPVKSEIYFNQQIFPDKFNPPRVTMLHPVGLASQAFEPFLTCKLALECGFDISIFPTPEARNEVHKDLELLGLEQVIIEDWLKQEDYFNYLEKCWGVIQLSGRPDLGRTVVMAAIAGIPSIAPNYKYQKILFPELIVNNFDDAYETIMQLKSNKNLYNECVEKAQDRLKLIHPKSVGQNIYDVIEKRT